MLVLILFMSVSGDFNPRFCGGSADCLSLLSNFSEKRGTFFRVMFLDVLFKTTKLEQYSESRGLMLQMLMNQG